MMMLESYKSAPSFDPLLAEHHLPQELEYVRFGNVCRGQLDADQGAKACVDPHSKPFEALAGPNLAAAPPDAHRMISASSTRLLKSPRCIKLIHFAVNCCKKLEDTSLWSKNMTASRLASLARHERPQVSLRSCTARYRKSRSSRRSQWRGSFVMLPRNTSLMRGLF
jgi:hypothetical protein